MKRIAALCLAVLLVVSMSACGSTTPDISADVSTSTDALLKADKSGTEGTTAIPDTTVSETDTPNTTTTAGTDDKAPSSPASSSVPVSRPSQSSETPPEPSAPVSRPTEPTTSTPSTTPPTSETRPPETIPPETTESKGDTSDMPASDYKVKISFGGHELTATIYNNATGRDFIERLPMTLPMLDLYGREMCYRFGDALATDNVQYTGYEVGEIVYWPPRHSFVILYAQNGEHFDMQKIGKLDSGTDLFNGIGDIDVTISLAE